MNIKQTIENYDIILHRFTEEKQEMIRQWRNDLKIAQFMDYQEEITPEQQLDWFHSIDNDYNLYYIIEFQGIECGVINIKDIDCNYTTGEVGIYIYEDKLLNTDIGYRAHLTLFDYVFEELGLNLLMFKIRVSNVRAQRLGVYIGIKKVETKGDFALWSLSKEDYFNNKNRMRFTNKCATMKNRLNSRNKNNII